MAKIYIVDQIVGTRVSTMFIIKTVSLLILVAFAWGMGYLVARWCRAPPDELIDEVPPAGAERGGTIPPQCPRKPASESR